jgi:hypothetical protein
MLPMSDQSGMSGTGGTDTAERGTVRYSVPQMARQLGISERAVRKQIESGKLFAVKEDRAWVVIVDRGAVPVMVLGGTDAEPGEALAAPAMSSTASSTAGTAASDTAGTAPAEPGTATSVAHDDMPPRDEVLTVGHAEPRGTQPEPGAVPEVQAAAPAISSAVPVPPVDLTPLVDLVADLTRRNAELTEAATIWQVRARQLEDQLKQLTAGETAQEVPQRSPQGAGEAQATSTTHDTSQPPQRPWWRRALGI